MITYQSAEDLKAALHRAEVAHGEYEKTLGHRDDNWPTWYAQFMAQGQTDRGQ